MATRGGSVRTARSRALVQQPWSQGLGHDADNPLVVDDEEDAQPPPPPRRSLDLPVPPLHLLHDDDGGNDPAHLHESFASEKRSGEARAKRGECARIDCISLVQASSGHELQWQSTDRALFAGHLAPQLTFQTDGIEVAWSEVDEAAASQQQRLSEGHTVGTPGSVSGSGSMSSRSSSTLVPPSPIPHGGRSADESGPPAVFTAPFAVFIPRTSIHTIDVQRYAPYQLTILCRPRHGFSLPLPAPPALSLKLHVEFDNPAAIQGENYHCIVATNSAYKRLIRLFLHPSQSRDLPSSDESAIAASSSASTSASASSSAPVPAAPSHFLVYPPSGKDQVVIVHSDLGLLKPGEFLNDSIVDFYLKHIFLNLTPELQEQFHFFNSFFYKRWCLAESTAAVSAAAASAASATAAASSVGATAGAVSSGGPSAEYAAVHRWAKNVDIFSKDFLVVPINESLHWSLAIICYPRLFFQPPPVQSSSLTKRVHGSHTATPPRLHSVKRPHGAKGVFGATEETANKRAKASASPEEPRSGEWAADDADEEVFVLSADTHTSASSSSSSAAGASAAASAAAGASSFAACVDLSSDPTQVPGILYFDSLLAVPGLLYKRLSQWLKEEWSARYPPPHPRSSLQWSQPPYLGGLEGPSPRVTRPSTSFGTTRESKTRYRDDEPLYEMRVPEQKNGCDCGLFLLEFTEQFCRSDATGGPQQLRRFLANMQQQQLAAQQRLTQTGAVRRGPGGRSKKKFEDIFFSTWKIASNMSEKRKKIRDLLQQEHAKVHAKQQHHEFVQQRNSYVQMMLNGLQAKATGSSNPTTNLNGRQHLPITAPVSAPPPPQTIVIDPPPKITAPTPRMNGADIAAAGTASAANAVAPVAMLSALAPVPLPADAVVTAAVASAAAAAAVSAGTDVPAASVSVSSLCPTSPSSSSPSSVAPPSVCALSLSSSQSDVEEQKGESPLRLQTPEELLPLSLSPNLDT